MYALSASIDAVTVEYPSIVIPVVLVALTSLVAAAGGLLIYAFEFKVSRIAQTVITVSSVSLLLAAFMNVRAAGEEKFIDSLNSQLDPKLTKAQIDKADTSKPVVLKGAGPSGKDYVLTRNSSSLTVMVAEESSESAEKKSSPEPSAKSTTPVDTEVKSK